jgi:hypothetical protein
MGLKLSGGEPARGTTGHLQSSVCRLQAPEATGAHNACFQQVQEDISKARSVNKDWEFVSKGTEISLGKFVPEYSNRPARADSPMADITEVEKSFCLSRPDGWVINRKMKQIILLEFKRTRDCGEGYFQDMWRVADKQHPPILTGLRT